MRHFTLPLTREERQSLRAGEQVLLSGIIYTARDAAHKRLMEMAQNNHPFPFELDNQVIYYVGPSQTPPHAIYGSAGPTTAGRMDAYTPMMLDYGMAGCIGKGRRTQAVKDALVKHQAIFYVAIGGLGAKLSKCVTKVEPVAFEDLQAEAITRLTVEELPVYVGIDCLGHDIYDE